MPLDHEFMSLEPNALLANLLEQCSKTQIDALACLRFGLYGTSPSDPHVYNFARLANSLNDMAKVATKVREKAIEPGRRWAERQGEIAREERERAAASAVAGQGEPG